MNEFIFNDSAVHDVSWSAELPIGMDSVDRLFDVFSETLRFPDYFGRNWDAFNECIRDLCWLPPGDVAIIHKDLPLRNDINNLRIYLDCLNGAVKRWKERGSNLICLYGFKDNSELEKVRYRNIKIVFPSDSKEIIQRIMLNSPF